jgi:sec-independent protein translocase protein TatB
MFEWGFWEFVLIGVIALVVIGPERLPRVARVAGLWIGRARRTLGTVQAEIRRELKADELKEIMDKQARSRPLETILEDPFKTAKPPSNRSDAVSDPGSSGLPSDSAPPGAPSRIDSKSGGTASG